jgi:hypothetical protein
MTVRTIVRRVPAFAAILVVGGCGGGTLDAGYPTHVTTGGGAPCGTASTYLGAAADSLKHGTISVTVCTSTTVSAKLALIGAPAVQLTGTVDTAAKVSATGGGYTLTGFTHFGTLQGSYTGPGGNGNFAAAADSLTGMSHATYCGSYQLTTGNGWFNVVALSDGEAAGFAVQTIGGASSSTFTFHIVAGSILGVDAWAAPAAGRPQAISLSGTLSADLQTMTGTYSPGPGNTAGTGSFLATTGGC